MSAHDTYPQHVVTAVIVAHDGAAWLPQVIDALLDQTRPVQRVVAVDTGSRDRSGAVLAGRLGQSTVFGMDRGTGYGAAVRRAVAHRAAGTHIPFPAGLPQNERVEWLWLLHDDCEPAADALEQLLRGAAETRSAAVLGPKVMDWPDRRVILEAGVTMDTVGRRITGIEPREVDQGQHDGDRDALAVGSAGMLIRRDVWDELGGFDTGMSIFRDDVDLCWRAHAAGYRVRVITDAVVYHVEAAARRRRPISVARRPRQADRRNALLTLLANLPGAAMLAAAFANLWVSALRSAFFLVAKRPAAALDEMAAVAGVLGHPLRLLRARHRRSRGRRAAYGRVRRMLPPGRSLRRIAEFAATAMSRSAQLDTAGSHHATDDPAEDDSLLVDTGLAQRILTSPGVLLFVGLTAVALVAERSLLGAGPLGGGALVPAWGGASGLWSQYLQGFHPVGIGSGSSAPPYLAVIAALATVLGGKPWLAIDVILLGCVPLAGMAAYAAARRVTRSSAVRVWAAAAYALLPVAMGTVSAGRFGTAVAFIGVPVIAMLFGRMLTSPGRRARRAAWATCLAIAIVAAFVPLVWVVALVAVLAFTAARPAMWRSTCIVALVPPALLMPWTLQVAAHPSALLLEAGRQQPGLASPDLPARSLMLLSPGGPGLPPAWVTAGLALAALAALLVGRRRTVVIAGWGTALLGLVIAVAVSHLRVTPASSGPAVTAWPGVAMIIAAAGLLLAAAVTGEAIPRLAGSGRRAARPLRWVAATILAAAACSAPLLGAAFWLVSGASGPVAPSAAPVVPGVVSASAAEGLQLRTLVLRSAGGRVDYALLRGSSPSLADPDLVPVPSAQRALNAAVAALVAPFGGEAVDQGQALAAFGVGFVLMPAPVNPGLARVLDGVAGLRPVSATSAFDLWRLVDTPSRVRVVQPDGTAVSVPSGQLSVSGAAAPAAGGTLELAEPAGGWSATLNGHPLAPVASPAGSWAQAFRLPSGGGRLDITRDQAGRDLILVGEALLLLVVVVLALPGTRQAGEEAVHAAHAAGAARVPAGASSAGTAPAGDTGDVGRVGGPVPAAVPAAAAAAAGAVPVPAAAAGRRRGSARDGSRTTRTSSAGALGRRRAGGKGDSGERRGVLRRSRRPQSETTVGESLATEATAGRSAAGRGRARDLPGTRAGRPGGGQRGGQERQRPGWAREEPGWAREEPAGWQSQDGSGWRDEPAGRAGWQTQGDPEWASEELAGRAGWRTQGEPGWAREEPAGWQSQDGSGWADEPAAARSAGGDLLDPLPPVHDTRGDDW